MNRPLSPASPPTPSEFVQAVKAMRDWQRIFFRTKAKTPAHEEAFWESKKAEKRVDQMVQLLDTGQLTIDDVIGAGPPEPPPPRWPTEDEGYGPSDEQM